MLRMLIIAWVTSVPVATSASAADDVETWFLRLWNESRAFPRELSQPLRFTYQTRELYVPSREQLEEMRSQVEGKPDHPLRHELGLYEQRARGEFTTTTVEVILGDPMYWRYSADSEFGSERRIYIDRGRDGKAVWSLTAGQLNIADAATPPEGYGYASYIDEIRVMAQMFFFQGIGIGISEELQLPPSFTRNGPHWTATISAAGSVFRYDGLWDDALGEGRIQVWTVVSSERFPDTVGERLVFGGHRADSVSGHVVSGRVTQHTSDGSRDREYSLLGCEQVTPEVVKSATQIPSLDRDDPKRGALSVDSIYDHRSGAPSWARSPDTGQFVRTSSPIRRYDSLRLAGWVTLAGLVVIAVAVRLARLTRTGSA
ncbi:MAG: hypothetical protein KF838_13825 [Phycisphaeraceae bacterium]|nr:MAG: hypothetical protein KF838_13825 [Phycisphaeraceae bacterium]